MTKPSYIASKGYQWYKKYIRFMNEHLLYRHVYYLHRENLPPLGQPCMIVSNHQNCANDPLNLLLGLENRSHPFVIARGNVFSWNPLITKFFLWLGMLPAFRLNYDGAESLSKNADTIRISGGKMLEGNRLIMYPEGTHQDKRWLGDFSYGYTRLLFQTAQSDNFQHDIQIVPSANHYAEYCDVQSDVLIAFGKPISLQPYYELYQTKPRTAQREVSKQVREQVEQLMLDIRDLEHYHLIDFLRNSQLGWQFCQSLNLNPYYLPDKLKADKQLVERLGEFHDWQTVEQLLNEENKHNISETDLIHQKGWGSVLLAMLLQLLLLPLWIVSLYPNIIHYNVHRPFIKTDLMFTNSWRFIIPAVVGVPFFFVLTVLICGLVWGWWWQSALWMLLASYPLALFAVRQWQWMKQTWRQARLLCKKSKLTSLFALRKQVFENIKNKLNL
ncbi:MAG: 1-acyl-sn-glycerol-3-phosphate acyltransferase [Paludibacteraceae bacterium]|nr:1-acyl-sn-glycerol-3-phosphate acyltransferase [Paludibacteraceae bacterium]